MKLGKTSWLLLSIGVFIIPLASLGTIHSQQVHQQNQLKEELASAELKLKGFQLEQLPYQQEELETRLSQTISQSEAAKSMLSPPIDNIAISSIVFDIAEAYGVAVIEIVSSGLTSDNLEGIPFSVLSFTVMVEGGIPGLVSFITRLNSDFTTGVVKLVKIGIPETTGEEKASANIQLVIYTYQGD